MEELINLFKKIFPFIVVGAGSGLAIYYYLKFMPNLEMSIIPRWINENKGHVVLRFEIKNTSLVRIEKKTVLIQMLEHQIPEIGQLSEWVPFAKNKMIKEESPIKWNEPIEILKTTRWLDAGSVVCIERFIHFNPNHILHVGLQFDANINLLDRIINRVRPKRLRWTSTAIIMSSKIDD